MNSNCPFCGSDSVKLMSSTTRGRGGKIELTRVYVRCNDCFARGSLMDTKERAVARWKGEKAEENQDVIEKQSTLLDLC